MSQVTACSPVQRSSSTTTAEQQETTSKIKEEIRDLRAALMACSQKAFRKFDKDGNQMPHGEVDLREALNLLDKLEREVPRIMILPCNRRRAGELLSATRRTVEKTCYAIDLLNKDQDAAEAGNALAEVFDEQQKLIDAISAEIPDESKLRHIRDVAQVILLVIGVAAFVVLNMFSFGLPALVAGAISLVPLAVGFSWNRIYDWSTTPCPVWKPMRELVSEIRNSVERSNMFATSVINRLEPRISNVESQMKAGIDKVESQMKAGIDKVESEMKSNMTFLRNEVDYLRKEVDFLRKEALNVCALRADFGALAEENRKLSALILQLLGRQTSAPATAANTEDAANEPSVALHVTQMG